MVTDKQIEDAKEVVAYYTLAAAATGAVPVPAASAAIVAQNGVMIAHVASAVGVEISVANIIESMGLAATLNVVGRNLFIEGAKLLSWGTASVWAAVALSALGATTAGVQTYIIGRIAIEIGKNGGKPLAVSYTSKIIDDCKATYDSFVAEWSKKKIKKPA